MSKDNFLKEYDIDITYNLKAVTLGITLLMDQPKIQVKILYHYACKIFYFKKYIQKEIYFIRDKIASSKGHGGDSMLLSTNIIPESSNKRHYSLIYLFAHWYPTKV